MRKKRELIIAIIYFSIAVLLYITASLILKDWNRYLFLLPLVMLFYLLRLAILLPFSKKARGKLNLTVRCVSYFFICTALVIGLLIIRNSYALPLYPYLQSNYSNAFNTNNIKSIEHAEDGRFIINTKNNQLKVLQLTDLHIGGSISTHDSDFNAFFAMYDVIKTSNPDLIIITGDLVYPIPVQSLTADNGKAFAYICDFMSRIGIPWAFVYGNHDTELISTYTPEDLMDVVSDYTFDNGGKLLFSDVQPAVYGRYNNLIEVRNADGSLNQALFLLDSNDYASTKLNDYDSIHTDQIEWYKETVNALNKREGHAVSSMLFFHIPLQEFEIAYQALLNGDNDAEYLFGSRREGCACPDKNSGLFDAVLKLGSTKAIFCGHDHLNDIGIRYKGIDLVYGKSIDYLAYPGIDKLFEQRGGTMITLKQNSKYEYTLISKE